ncbi:GAF and ANTAR domain-containing protein [Pseudonocardia abyssalis]|uniref:GAF and ANTAR domain-containing protein n=1 Tax=Pseudonocardia abyssalis TaxID=2792008 RepID=A0ABS6UY85_9PSEU|nr:GAF and ANTAR domain-containing protein [Pseudonocardia abyssalis]MBW0114821.1 GAF and ANTAR domain-containing protein [Pseudonocardia abyssalis]MBW0137224.1 GAF and ANTAR domain-containing protein [Pseudonocardia abyssalis]
MTRPDREERVGRAFVALADSLVDDYDVVDLLSRLVVHSVELLAADAAGLLLADSRQELRVVAASSEDATTMELLALQSDEGPCLECYRSAAQVRVPDLADRTATWPAYTVAVERSGAFRSVHALPLRLRGQAIGVLALFHRNPGPLPEPDLLLGQALADVATIGILSERAIRRGTVLNEQLQSALDSRVVIEQAKGVVSQRTGLGMDEAFTLLRSYARRSNTRLAEISRQIVDRELDPAALPVPRPARSGPRTR